MPLFLSLATALSISAAAFFSGVNYRHDNNVEAQAQAQTNIQSNIETDHAGTADVSNEIKTANTDKVNAKSTDSSDEKFDLSAIGTLSSVFGDDEEDVSTDASGNASYEESEDESDDASMNVHGSVSSDHVNATGNVRSDIDL